jgi:translation initiation factor IF-3
LDAPTYILQEAFSISGTRSSNPNYPTRQPAKGPQVLNERIRATEVRLIDGDSNTIVPRQHAEALARERGLDLLVVSLESSPPVVRLVDYGKFKFESEKKAREAKKKQHVVEVKEVKCGIRIDKHDYEVKLHNAQRFLQEGDKVKVTIRLKGREVQHSNLAFDLANRFVADLTAFGQLEGQIRQEGRQITLTFHPLKVAAPPKASTDKPSSAPAVEE